MLKMIKAYMEGKDLYAEIASIAFDVPYEECLEFRPGDGTRNPEGKERRTKAKAIVLGVCYGKGVPAIAADLKIKVNVAQQIFNKIMTEFPGLQAFMDESQNMAREKGYVTTVWGRKRRLPDMQLPLYEFQYVGAAAAKNVDLFFDDDDEEVSTEVPEHMCRSYYNRLANARSWKERENIKQRAEAEGVYIKDNSRIVAEATRQCQ